MESWKLAALESGRAGRWKDEEKRKNREGNDFPSAVSFWFHFNHWKHSALEIRSSLNSVRSLLLIVPMLRIFWARISRSCDRSDEDSQEKHFIFQIIWKTTKVYWKFSCLLLFLILTRFVDIFRRSYIFHFSLPFPVPHECCYFSKVKSSASFESPCWWKFLHIRKSLSLASS